MDERDPAERAPAPLEEAGVRGEDAVAAPAAPPTAVEVAEASADRPKGKRPTFVFFGIVAAISLLLDVTTKAWAETTLMRIDPVRPTMELIPGHLAFTLAYNPGGAWGLFQTHDEMIRRPFFLLVSALAIVFIINLYGRLLPGQRALTWGLPLVLGGALGNLMDRIVRSNVIDFIDYQASWILAMNRTIAKVVPSWSVTDHWPTFNVADISICVGVGLMAVDMFTSRRGPSASLHPPPAEQAPLASSDAAPVKLPDSSEPLKPGA
jgi:signal peptidase II